MNPPDIPSSSSAAASAAPAPLPIDYRVPLMNLSTVRMRMDSVQHFLSQTLSTNTLLSPDQFHLLSSEILSALHQAIVNGAALLSSSILPPLPPPPPPPTTVTAAKLDDPHDHDYDDKDAVALPLPLPSDIDLDHDLDPSSDCDIIELDAVELLAEHIHFCEICGKGFKRDANLRMHMRAHGNQFKTPKALSKPVVIPDPLPSPSGVKVAKFSCPFQGCNRNKAHKKFRPLKSVICVKNHFKRSHCPKMYSCNRCNKKSFSVLADLKSHLKHCGENRWRCSCGTSFSRKDKLFGHLALFEGHMPVDFGECSAPGGNRMEDDEVDEDIPAMEDSVSLGVVANTSVDDGFFEGLLDGFGSTWGYSLHDAGI
ncbi:hypothetical protein MLD38_011204 [Melastoma candidum]|uniref:Uncharacterized protein n=1 Tax=Melastoma candidum TaxID=119954 RepID=A0ACB9R2B2_9MYRT|nr:hypothetical protein MLD38_011204 [Melastoma candidum]